MILSQKDISVPGGGFFGVERFYNNLAGAVDGPAGFNWQVTQFPTASMTDGSTVAITFHANQTFWFVKSGTTYTPLYASRTVSLSEDPSSHALSFSMTSGPRVEVTVFNSVTATTNPGAFVSHTDAGGITTTATRTGSQVNELQRSFTSGGTTPVTTVESLDYSYVSGKLQTATRLSKVGSAAAVPIERMAYAYYSGGNLNGNSGDLQSASRQLPDGSGGWNTVAVDYYRYYVSGSSFGFTHGLKMHFGPEAYRLIFNAGISLPDAGDDAVRGYADHYFEYDSDTRAVTKEISAVCESCPGGGTTLDVFAYTPNPRHPSDGYNVWAVMTVQALPPEPGSTLSPKTIVYTNYAGQPMLYVNVDAAGTSRWITFFRYDDNGYLIWKAHPSAVNSYDDTHDDLMGFSGWPSTSTHLNATGLIEVTAYYAADDLPNGKVKGSVSDEYVQNGQSGTPVATKSYTYFTSGPDNLYPVATETTYPDAGGTSPTITTGYGYTWHTGTTQLSGKVTTLPNVGTDQNGDGATVTIIEEYDTFGNLTQRTDERGIVNQYVYDPLSGRRKQQTLNVQSGSTTDPSANGVTDFDHDAFGRLIQTLGPWHTVALSTGATSVRGATWSIYNESVQPASLGPTPGWGLDQTWTATGYATGADPSYTLTAIGPISITRMDKDRRVTDRIANASTDPAQANVQGNWRSWSSTQYSDKTDGAATPPTVAHQKVSDRVYHLIPSSGTGTVGTHFGQTAYGYDSLERLTRVQAPGGTITRSVRNTPLLRVDAAWVGTDDTGATGSNPAGSGSPNNMVKVVENQYDNGGIGDGNLTQSTQHASNSTSDDRVTKYGYDFRDRRTSMTDALGRYTSYDYDNLDRQTWTYVYDSAGTGRKLIAQSRTLFDDRGRVYQTLAYAVVPSTGTVGNILTANNWYDYSGNLIQSISAGDGKAFTKQTYNGVNWVTASYRGYNTSGTSYAQASESPDTASDTIFSQAIPTYNEVGSVVFQKSYDRLNDATGTGQLNASVTTQPAARVSYAAAWFDGIDRPNASANYGARATAPTPPTTPPTSDATVLVSLTAYDDAGRVGQTTDPMGVVNRTAYDAAARTIQTIEDYSTSSGHLNRTTKYAYTLDNQIATLTAVNTDTGDQTTTYTYGTTLAESGVARNDLLRMTAYPRHPGWAELGAEDWANLSVDGLATLPVDSAADVTSVTYNRLGQQATFTDQRGTVRSFDYDPLGRLTADRVTQVGTDTDSAVLRISRTYEVRGMVETITSYNNATVGSGTVLNQLQLDYNGFGQLITEWQAHGGTVSTSSTPKVQYAYDSGASDSNQIRFNTLTYPNGRAIAYDYGTPGGMNDYLNRINSLIDAATSITLSAYTYLGSGTVIRIAYPQPNVWLDLWGGTSGAFNGLDPFNRVIDQLWQNHTNTTPAAIDEYKYGYDRNSNRLWKKNTVAAAASIGLDELYAYDPLNRLTQMQRGVLNSAHTAISGTPDRQMNWTLDIVGNWNAYQTKTGGTTDLNQTRAANKVNEITAIGGTPGWATPPTYDPAGNMTSMPQVVDPTQNFTAAYDAWNRMTGISNSGGTVATYKYDGRNRRIVKVTAATGSTAAETRHFYYTTRWQDIEERVGTATTADRQYVWGIRYIDELVCRDAPNFTPTRLYACQDANFNLTAIVASAGGAVQERYQFDPYGKRTVLNSGWAAVSATAYAWIVGHQGLMQDVESGLIHNRERYVHSTLGNYGSRDPIDYVDGLSLYQINQSSPLQKLDPFGLTVTGPTLCQTMTTGNASQLQAELADLERRKDYDWLTHGGVPGPDSAWLWQQIQLIKGVLNGPIPTTPVPADSSKDCGISLKRIDQSGGHQYIEVNFGNGIPPVGAGFWPSGWVTWQSGLLGGRRQPTNIGTTNRAGGVNSPVTGLGDPYTGSGAGYNYSSSMKKKGGKGQTMGFGSAAGKLCSCTTCRDVWDCIQSFKPSNPTYGVMMNNCRDVSEEALSSCCMSY